MDSLSMWAFTIGKILPCSGILVALPQHPPGTRHWPQCLGRPQASHIHRWLQVLPSIRREGQIKWVRVLRKEMPLPTWSLGTASGKGRVWAGLERIWTDWTRKLSSGGLSLNAHSTSRSSHELSLLTTSTALQGIFIPIFKMNKLGLPW